MTPVRRKPKTARFGRGRFETRPYDVDAKVDRREVPWKTTASRSFPGPIIAADTLGGPILGGAVRNEGSVLLTR